MKSDYWKSTGTPQIFLSISLSIQPLSFDQSFQHSTDQEEGIDHSVVPHVCVLTGFRLPQTCTNINYGGEHSGGEDK